MAAGTRLHRYTTEWCGRLLGKGHNEIVSRGHFVGRKIRIPHLPCWRCDHDQLLRAATGIMLDHDCDKNGSIRSFDSKTHYYVIAMESGEVEMATCDGGRFDVRRGGLGGSARSTYDGGQFVCIGTTRLRSLTHCWATRTRRETWGGAGGGWVGGVGRGGRGRVWAGAAGGGAGRGAPGPRAGGAAKLGWRAEPGVGGERQAQARCGVSGVSADGVGYKRCVPRRRRRAGTVCASYVLINSGPAGRASEGTFARGMPRADFNAFRCALQGDLRRLEAVVARRSGGNRRLLLERGELEQTALHGACRSSHESAPRIVELLLSAAPSLLDATDTHGRTALHLCADGGASGLMGMLLLSGAATCVKDAQGCTALMRASIRGHAEAARLLVAAGAALDLCDATGVTALFRAVLGGFEECVRVRRDHGG